MRLGNLAIRHRLRGGFVSCERGVSFVELAMILPFLLMLSLATADVALGFAAKLALEQAAQRTTDYALAKRPNEAGDTSYLTAEAAEASGQPAGNVTVDAFLECGGVRQSSFTGTCSSGLPARIIKVRIIKNHKLLFDYGKLTAIFKQRLMPNEVILSGDSSVRIS